MYPIAPIRCFFSTKMLIVFFFLHKVICCGYSLEAPQLALEMPGLRLATSKYSQHVVIRKMFSDAPVWYPDKYSYFISEQKGVL